MFDRFKSLFDRKVEAATQLAPVSPIKAKPGMRSWPAFFSTKKPADAVMTRPERNLINADVTNYRTGNGTVKVLQDLVASSPELSNAVYTAIRIGVPDTFVATAHDMDGTLNVDATRLLQTLITCFDVIGNPLEGYTGSGSTSFKVIQSYNLSFSADAI